MPRIARKNLNTPFIHVIVQGINKEYIFSKDEYIETYLNIFAKNKKIYDFTVIAYCIMNNHAHFLIYTENIKDFGKFMQKTNLIYAQRYNKEENRCGVLFRNRYCTEPIYDKNYIINCIKYIHDNPVKAKMVLKCEEYRYSSYRDYINNTGVTQSEIMKEIFGQNCDYLELFNRVDDMRFIDINEESLDEKIKYIIKGINKFKKENNIELYDILSDECLFKKLIYFLKNKFGVKYVEIRNFFEISKGTMDYVKLKWK